MIDSRTVSQPYLPWIAAGFVFGIIGSDVLPHHALPFHPLIWLWGLAVPLAFFSLCWKKVGSHAGMFCALMICGWAAVPATSQSSRTPHLVDVCAEVTAVRYQERSQVLVCAVQEVYVPQGKDIKRITCLGPCTDIVSVGDMVRVRGVWQMVSYKGRERPEIRATDIYLEESRYDGTRGWAWRAIGRIGVRQELAATLLLGSGRPPERNVFRQAGLAHIMAVSGLHVGLALLSIVWICRICAVPWLWRQGLVLIAAGGYVWLTGGSMPTQRAALMAIIIIVAQIMRRELHPLTALSLTVLCLIVIDPADIKSLSFQLSACAVLGILTLGRSLLAWRMHVLPLNPWPLDRPLWRVLLYVMRAFCDGILVGVSASLATAPLIMTTFAELHIWSPVATVLATPFLVIILAIGLPTITLHALWEEGPWQGLFWVCEVSFEGLCTIAQWCASWPYAYIKTESMPIIMIFLWPLLFACAAWKRPSTVEVIDDEER